MNKFIFFGSLIIFTSILFGCDDDKDESFQNTVNESSENNNLSNRAIDRFSEIYKNFPIDGHEYVFDRGERINPKFDHRFLLPADTLNTIFYRLYEDTLSIVVGVNTVGCHAAIITKFEGFYYPHQNSIHLADFSFLNEENSGFLVSCENNDPLDFRMVSYQKNLIGMWSLDSVKKYRTNYEQILELNSLEFFKNSIIINDDIEKKYENDGFNLSILNTPYYFYKLFVNQNFMILINVYEDSYEEYYFRKV